MRRRNIHPLGSVLLLLLFFNTTNLSGQLILLSRDHCHEIKVSELECVAMMDNLRQLMIDYSDFKQSENSFFAFEPTATHPPDFSLEDKSNLPIRKYLEKWEDAQRVKGKTFVVDSVIVTQIQKSIDNNWIITLEIHKSLSTLYFKDRKGWVDAPKNKNHVVSEAEVLWGGISGGKSPKIREVRQLKGVKIKKAAPSLNLYGLYTSGSLPVESNRIVGINLNNKLNLCVLRGGGIIFGIPMFQGALNLELGAQFGLSNWQISDQGSFSIEGANPYAREIVPIDDAPLAQTKWTWRFNSFNEVINSRNLDLIAGIGVPLIKRKVGLKLDFGGMYNIMNMVFSKTSLFENEVSLNLTFSDGSSESIQGSTNPLFPVIGFRPGEQVVNGNYSSSSFICLYSGLSMSYAVSSRLNLTFAYRFIYSTTSPFSPNNSSIIYGTVLKNRPLDSRGFLNDYFTSGQLLRNQLNFGLTIKI